MGICLSLTWGSVSKRERSYHWEKENSRFPRTLRTAIVSAFGALNRPAVEQCGAHMAGSPHPLRYGFVDHLLASRRRGYRKRLQVQPRVPNCSSRGPSCDYRTSPSSYTLSFLIPDPLCWVPRAFLASIVLTIPANLVRSESGLASVAGTVDSHADLLLHALCVWLDR